MLFSSQAFLLLFLPLALALYHAFADSYRARLWALTLCSFGFYAWWDVRFLPLLVAAITLNWALGRWYLAAGRPRGLIVVGITCHLALLGFFKYANFFADALAALIGLEHQRWSIVLPLAISFFTFQQISYLVDLKRGKAPAYDWLQYTAYIVFFPHLIAGPIVRHNELIGQFDAHPHRPGAMETAARGLVLFTLGLVKKVFFADELAPIADPVFDAALAGAVPATLDAWLGAFAYSLQLYFDFSAYSDMAIGLAALFGLRLPLNFDRPYRALSIREFWRRWHMTLSRFFRDYLYIPLGGNRGGFVATCALVMFTMTLCGLWHGAGWTFIAWGALHGLAIVGSRAWGYTRIPVPALLGWGLTMGFVVIGWVLFRAESFGAAANVLRGMAGQGAGGGVPAEGWTFVALGALCALLGPTNVDWTDRRLAPRLGIAALAAFALFVVTLRVGQGRGLDFIYFQF
ncbi:MAG TPA: MBOAT family protein [Gammaproteobacteria bacterium]|nr:MBOAT family protein [Gammaproteobacteria bacterium]